MAVLVLFCAERALRCPICQSCVQNATMISVCCHVYCEACLQLVQTLKECPICKQKCSKRSLVDVPQLDTLVLGYKRSATAHGLLPALHDSSLVGMTQLPASQQQNQCSLAEVHDQVLATRTFAKYCPSNEVYQAERQALVRNAERNLVQQATQRKPKANTRAVNQPQLKVLDNLTVKQPETAKEDFFTAPQFVPPWEQTTEETIEHISTRASDEGDLCNNVNSKPAALGATFSASETHAEIPIEVRERTLPNETVIASNASLDKETTLVNHTALETVVINNEPKDEHQNDSAVSTPPAAPLEMPSQEQCTAARPSLIAQTKPSDETTNNVNPVLPAEDSISNVSINQNETQQALEPFHQETKEEDETATEETTNTGTDQSTSAQISFPPASAVISGASISERPVFDVGDIVQVQPRTWPGVNLPGGVGRIKAVYLEKDHLCYDIDYVLGGRERKVDAVFCVASNLPSLGRRKSNQRQPVASQRLQQKQTDGVLPPLLLAQLKSEGFDVEGNATVSQFTDRTKARAGVVQSKVSGKKENKIPKPAARPPAATATTTRKRKPPTRNERSTTSKRPRTGKSILVRMTNLGKRKAPAIAPSRVPPTDEEACATADQMYQERFQKAIKKSTISLAASSLSEDEMRRVEQLCRQKTVRVKLSSSLSKQTTFCVVQADPKSPTMAKVRTAKVMRAALLGIPLVTPAWIDACLSTGRIAAPSTYLRALPTKSRKSTGSSCGVAQLIARPRGILFNHHIYLCLPPRAQQDVIQLIKDAGGTVTSRLTPPGADQPLVILCGDTDHGVSGPVQKAVTKDPGSYLVVHQRWFFDSISGGALAADLSSYGPPSPKAQALWQLCTGA